MLEVSLDGSHPLVQRLVRLAERLAGTNLPVHIVGESGTGRATLARVIHARSGAPADGFAALDCARLADGAEPMPEALHRLLDGEHAPAATPATVLLREPGELAADLQDELAIALAAARESAPRIIASTRGEPGLDGQARALRPDLEAALARVQLFMPPLRERRSDVPLLVTKILEERGARGEPPCRITTEAMVLLWEHDWPGNVRELKQMIEDLARASADGVIDSANLPPEIRGLASSPSRRPAIATVPPRYRVAS